MPILEVKAAARPCTVAKLPKHKLKECWGNSPRRDANSTWGEATASWVVDTELCLVCGEHRPKVPSSKSAHRVRKALGQLWLCTECFTDCELAPLKTRKGIDCSVTTCSPSTEPVLKKNQRVTFGACPTVMGKSRSTPGFSGDSSSGFDGRNDSSDSSKSSGGSLSKMRSTGRLVLGQPTWHRPAVEEDGIAIDQALRSGRPLARKPTRLWLEEELLSVDLVLAT